MRACGLVLHGPASRSQIRSSRACTLIVRSPRLAKRQFRHGAGTAAQCSSASRLVHSSSFLVHGLCQPGKASQINPGIVGLTADPVARDAVENLASKFDLSLSWIGELTGEKILHLQDLQVHLDKAVSVFEGGLVPYFQE